MRRPQVSELIRSPSCQSGPDSKSTTRLPALVRTEAKTEPEAPAPTMTTSTFSFAMSPAPGRRDVGLIGHAEMGVAVHGAVDDVDRVGAHEEINEGRAGALPVVELVLAHQIDEVVLFGGGEGCKAAAAIFGLARTVDGAE